MKTKITKFSKLAISAWIFSLISSVGFASISFDFNADRLVTDDLLPLPSNSLFLLVADTSGEGFNSSLAPTASLQVGDTLSTSLDSNLKIIARGGIGFEGFIFSNTGPLLLDNTASGTVPGEWRPSNNLALYWFDVPETVASLTGGESYGFYHENLAGTSLYSDSNNWVTPADGASDHQLYFYTESAILVTDGNNDDSFGQTSLTVVPEPAAAAVFFGASVLGLVFLRRRFKG